jgi:hypothetical protein
LCSLITRKLCARVGLAKSARFVLIQYLSHPTYARTQTTQIWHMVLFKKIVQNL